MQRRYPTVKCQKINNNTIEATEKYMNEEGDIANKTMVFKLNAQPSRN